MVFLFPGVLFRKFYFSGKFTKQFSQGNLLERFLWTLFCGVVSLSICGALFYLINVEWKLELTHNMTFESISSIFQCLSTNKYPPEFSNKDSLKEIGMLLVIVYAFSILAGLLCVKLVRLLSFDLYISILRFNNDWVYISEPTKSNGVERSFLDVYTPYVDILIIQKDKEELYRGVLHDFFYDKENKLEHIVIKSASKFIKVKNIPENEQKIKHLKQLIKNGDKEFSEHKSFPDEYVFKKKIQGDRLVLSALNMTNINFTYAKIESGLNKFIRKFLLTTQVILWLIIAGLIVLPAINIEYTYLDTFVKKLTFSITSFFVIATLYTGMKDFLLIRKSFKEPFFNALFLATPYLWVFNIFEWYWTIGAALLAVVILTAITGKIEVSNSDEQNR